MDRMVSTTNALIALVIAMSLVAVAIAPFGSTDSAQDFELPTGPLPMVDRSQKIGFSSADLLPLAKPALAQITYPWQTYLSDWTIQFVPGEGNVAGYTWSAQRHIEIFVRPGDDSDQLARVLAHELGHAVDVTLNTADERRAWLEQRQASTQDWWPNPGQADFSAGAGDFAESFAYWQLRDTKSRSEIAGTPSDSDLALLVQLARP